MMVSEQENLLEFCNVEYGYRGFHAHFAKARLLNSHFSKNVRGAQFQESQVVIENCRFQDNLNGVQDSVVTLRNSVISGSHWGLRCVYSELEMTSCLIENNLVNGANIRDGKLNISGNRITGNRRGLYLQRSKGQVVGNDLSANSEHGIFLEDSEVEVADNRLVENGRAGVRWLNSEGRLARNQISETSDVLAPRMRGSTGNWGYRMRVDNPPVARSRPHGDATGEYLSSNHKTIARGVGGINIQFKPPHQIIVLVVLPFVLVVGKPLQMVTQPCSRRQDFRFHNFLEDREDTRNHFGIDGPLGFPATKGCNHFLDSQGLRELIFA